MQHFVQRQPDPGRWHVHAFQAELSAAEPAGGAALQRAAKATARMASSVTLHDEAVGAAILLVL